MGEGVKGRNHVQAKRSHGQIFVAVLEEFRNSIFSAITSRGERSSFTVP